MPDRPLRKLYPGNLQLLKLVVPNSNQVVPAADSVATQNTSSFSDTFFHHIPVRRKAKVVAVEKDVPVVVSVGMDSFRKYQDSVNDAWSTEEAEDPAESSAGSSRLPNVSNGVRAVNNRVSSDHLRARGLQRLALQSGSVSGGGQRPALVRPGMAIRAATCVPLSNNTHTTQLATEHADVSNHTALSPSTPMDFLPRHTQKADKFQRLFAEKSLDLDELRKLSWSGVPSELRARVWRLLCGYAPPVGDPVKLQESLQRKREEYSTLVSDYYPKREDDQYKDTFHQIHIDVPRMCPLVPLFQQTTVQEIFERVLFIWALRHPASGYVQGINDLVTPYFIVFLRDYIPAKEAVETFCSDKLAAKSLAEIEADSFWCLSKLLAGIQNNYTFAQPGIQQRVLQLKELIQRVDVELHRHLEKCSVEYLQFSFRWMNNLLIRELPLNCIIRLWDSYHSEADGFANFHVYVCASFLLWWSEDLRNQPDFQHSLMLLQNLPTQNWGEDQVERLLAKAFMLKYAFADAPRHLKSN